MKRVEYLIFAGTSEGRKLAEILNTHEISACVCVATAYGEEQMKPMPWIQVRVGRLDLAEMKQLIQELQPQAVVDATHPYASQVTEHVKMACAQTQMRYIRLLRPEQSLTEQSGVFVCANAQEAADWLDTQEGNMLLTTGAKELPVFAAGITDRERIFARVLLQESLFAELEQCGLAKNQLICMQGPFSRAFNVALLRQINAKFLVTKESGSAGGFQEKLEAAKEAGAVCVVIQRPMEESGFSLTEVVQMLLKEEPKEAAEVQQTVTLLGIGMGSFETMTIEADNACRQADCIIGAKRMCEALSRYQKPLISMYRSEEITAFIQSHPQYRRVVIALSGDVGFYSGAKKLTEQMQGMQVRLICGISSVVYFAAKLQTSWEDMTLVSSHGRNQNIIGAVFANPKVFTLVSKADSVRSLAEELIFYGLEHIKMHVGADLSYPTETIKSGVPQDFLAYQEGGICVVLLENPDAVSRMVTHGLPDEAFIRGKVPMTKEEVRSVSVAKMHLTKDAVVYDVGAGTGSVSVECARVIPAGTVYAIERKEEALALLEKNRRKFGLANMIPVAGLAPEAFAELPAPTHVFIGGSGGNLKEIVHLLLQKNPQVRIVINCIALETVAEAMALTAQLQPEDLDICCVNAAKGKELAGYHMMMGQNPVYVIAFQMRKSD